MTNLFGINVAGIITSTFAGQLHALTLHKFSSASVDDYGQPVKTSADHAGEGVRAKWKTETVVQRGWPANTAKIIILQNGMAEPMKGDELTIDGERWSIIDKEQDPVNATWAVAAVKV